jgi:hypothetical protein
MGSGSLLKQKLSLISARSFVGGAVKLRAGLARGGGISVVHHTSRLRGLKFGGGFAQPVLRRIRAAAARPVLHPMRVSGLLVLQKGVGLDIVERNVRHSPFPLDRMRMN